ncbi:Methyltransferase type 11 [Emticicia oligotrophica DSM 17448]|uniref:Methyltransferase type 11 n=1 Tax=Emticicia oligotrophica (strain DSM 17448 / CIP 109782 / MTCC 6937 / GPTSA100-15) TaxID=929562 RepID=A0ABN4ALE6_EMTOG|nr:class I SAM-dependent methyltransferase [Emticicia oligotrophica]AFK03161.1 Methyltransferase type 11 [Emticicia oligotrophica DSM 17448]
MKEWFTEWFDTSFYHQLYKSRCQDEAKMLIDNLEKKLNFQKTQSFLDLACGKGRHAIYLNSKDYHVIGLDLSRNNIESANQSANKHLHFFVHDMRTCFRPNTFDFVLNLFTSFGYFDDDQDNFRAINAVADNLKSGGKLVLDYINCTKAINNLSKHYEKEVEGIKFIITKQIEAGFIVKNIDFDFEGSHHQFQERVKILTQEDFKAYFKKAGLICKEVLGNYHLETFDEQNSDRMIFIAEKLDICLN